MSCHGEEMKILCVHGEGALPLAVDGHDTLLTASEVKALNSLSADHSAAKSLERGERLVCREELSVQQTPDTISIKVEEDIGGGLPAVEDDGNDSRDCCTQRGVASVDAPGSSHMSSHNGELRILSVYGKGEGPLAVDGHDTLFAASELEALSSLSADHSVAKSLNCSVRLVRLEELTGHRGGRKGRPGVLCGKVIPNNAIHTDEKPYGCDECMKRFSRKGYLKRHMITHYGKKPYSCDKCTRRFLWHCELKLHMTTHSGLKPYRCDQCMKLFSQKCTLKRHMRSHSGVKPYKCDQCTMSFTVKGTLKIHMRTHSGEKPYKCDQCTKSFSLSPKLKIHISTHSTEKPHKCNQCVKCFSHIFDLNAHMRTHTGEKPYKCDQCTKCFSLKGNLKSHMWTHSGEKPYKCDQCMKGSVAKLEPFHWDGQEDCAAFGDRSTQRSATSESLGVDAPGSSHMARHREELKILIIHEKGEGRLAIDGHDTLFTASEVKALNSLSADHSVAKSLERGKRLVCREELSVQQQTPDTISIKLEEDVDGGMPAVEDCDAFGDRSTQRGGTSESLGVNAPGSSHMSSHSGELKILSIYGQGEGPLAVDGHDTLLAKSEPEALSSLSADHSVAKSLNCSVRLVRLEELTGHQGGRKGRPGVLCGKVIPNNANMIVHMRTHSGEKSYRCDQCMRHFSVKTLLKRHMMTHSGEKPYKCDQCTMRFSRNSQLKIHMMTHSGEKPYKCDQCTKRFGESSKLKIHMRTHTGEKPYKCDQCTKRCRQRYALVTHMRTHSGEKPYKCDQCTKCFSRGSYLKIHIRTHSDCDAFVDRSTQRGATSESLVVDAPGPSHMSSHTDEMKILCVHGKGDGPLAVDGHDTLFTASEVEALNSLPADHSAAKSLERGERLVCREELSVQQQTPDTISIKVEEDIGGGSPSVEDGIDIRDCSTQRGATSESLRVDAPGSSHMSSHNRELRSLSVYGQGEGLLAVDGHDTLFAASELEALSSLSADHSVAKSLNCSVRLVRLEELTGHQGGRKGRPGVLCGKVIPNDANMIHTDEEQYKCDHCMMCFSRKGYLKVHMRTHSGEKPFRCDQCTKRFTQSGSLKVHMRTHSGEKPYRCDQCIKRFSQNGALKVHMRTHSGEKPYRCDRCTMRFRKKSHLKIHLMIHSGEKPYKCDQCTKRYTHISALKTHMRTHTGETPFKCDQCTKRFSLKGTLNRHIATHSGEKPYKCDQCTKRFGEKSKLKRHMRTHSGEKPYGCDQYMKSSVVEQEHFQWDGQEVCDAFGDSSTQRSATSAILGVDSPDSSHLASHREELKIVIVHEEGDGQLVVDGHDTLFTASEVEALNSLSADHSAAKSLERGERLVCHEELSVQQQTPDTISIKVEEDIGGGMPAVEDVNDIRDCSTQRGATSESLRVDAPGSCMSSHNGELQNLSVYGQGEDPLAVDGHDTLFSASEPEALSSLSADHSVAKSLNCSVRLVRLEELTGHQGGRKGRPGVLGGKVIPNNDNMIVNMSTNTNEKPHRCAQCMMPFQWKSDLKIHMRTHTGEKPYKCDQCTKRFSRTGTLKIHIRTHSGEKPYRCDQCTMRFRHGSALKFHMRTHTGEKPYRCDQCTKSFIRKDALTFHLRSHSGEKPCVCLQCNACYSSPSSLRLHMLKHTGNGVL
ncbi:unnamed protein product [Arctogadus glacialis]